MHMTSAHSSAKIGELLQEDQNTKQRRERYQKQSAILSKLTRQLGIHDNRAAAASNWSSGSGGAGKFTATPHAPPPLLTSLFFAFDFLVFFLELVWNLLSSNVSYACYC